MPTNTLGKLAGNMTRQKMSRLVEPSEAAARKYRTSMAAMPSTMFKTTVKKAPKKVTKIMLISAEGQKTTETGTQAKGGTGRMISIKGKTISLAFRLKPKRSPKGTPKIWAMTKPVKIRAKLVPQERQ
jgi:hypothetical protein